jgi:hypothetical protein
VSEEFLHYPKIGTSVEEMSGEGMAQGVGMRRTLAPAVEETPHVTGRQPPAAPVEEHGTDRGFGPDEPVPALGQPGLDGLGGRLGHWHHPLFASFAPHREPPPGGVKVAQVEPTQLRNPQATAVEELEDGPVPQADTRPVAADARRWVVEEGFDLGPSKDTR